MDTYSLVNRFKEPSSWAGIAGLVAMFGVPLGVAQALVVAVAGVCGAIAVLMPQRQNMPQAVLASAPAAGLAAVVALVPTEPVGQAHDDGHQPGGPAGPPSFGPRGEA